MEKDSKITTQSQVKEIFHYDPETGCLYFKTKIGLRLAGSVGSRGRVYVSVSGVRYHAHHLVWLYFYGELPANVIDHIDHNPTNNRIENLRDVRQKMNMRNCKMYSTNTTGVTGVHWNKLREIWTSSITVDREALYLGSFDSLLDAACARKAAEIEHGFHPNHGLTA